MGHRSRTAQQLSREWKGIVSLWPRSGRETESLVRMKYLGKYTKVSEPKMLEESYRFGIDSFFKDFKTPPDGIRLMVDQLASSRMIDANLAQKTPLTAYYENRYVEELEKEGFFKKLWQ